MAVIGLYGVYYSKATVTAGVISGYTGAKEMGKAISATFTPATVEQNPLYANNGIAETDPRAASGGELALTLDKLTEAAFAEIYGVATKTASVTVGTDTVVGTGFDFTGAEETATVGIAFIRWKQESQNRNIHEVILFSHCTFAPLTEEAQTMGETVEWQTPSLSATVAGPSVTGSYPWAMKYTFPSQAAAIAFITDCFAAN